MDIRQINLDEIAPASVSTDTRTIGSGDVFFAFVGENHDAHDHLDAAAASRASALVVSDVSKVPADFDGVVYLVPDTLRAYQDLAAHYRDKVDPYVIGITGSVGKTTLKDMVYTIAQAGFKTVATQGNFNNQIGLPKTVLGMPEDTEVLVLELGMGGPGEIKRLAEIARPDAAAITNIGTSHRDSFDSDDGIMLEKFSIASMMKEGNRLVIDRDNCEALTMLAREEAQPKGYALVEAAPLEGAGKADYRYTPVSFDTDTLLASFEISSGERTAPFAVPASGNYASLSATLACALVSGLGIDLETAAESLKKLVRTPHRLQPIRENGVLVIDDTYNASPDSTRSGLSFLKTFPAKRRIAVLADMNDHGPESEFFHRSIGRDIGEDIAAGRIYGLICLGEKARAIAAGAKETSCEEERIRSYIDRDEMIDYLKKNSREGDAYLVKGSHSMKMDLVAAALSSREAEA